MALEPLPTNQNQGSQEPSRQAGRADPNAAVFERLATEFIKEQKSARRMKFISRILVVLVVLLIFAASFRNTPVVKNECKTECAALVRIDGEIAADADASADHIITGLQDAFSSKHVRGIILEINSPGGSPVESGRVYDEIKRLRQLHTEIPIYVVVDDIAASGAYYIAAASDMIYVDKASLVGSIGVIMSGFGFTGAMEKLGIEQRTQTAGKNKAFMDPFSPANAAQQEHMQKLLDNVHQQFITAVKEGRGKRLPQDASDDLFSGLIWTGEDAVKLGLADDFGSAAFVAREIINTDDIHDFTYEPMWSERLVRRFGASVAASLKPKLLHWGY
ncbi:MAG: S49 family peptidase [Burkholderiales bacterium]|jgi:protease-4|nr:S49 family peptidase [Burkholderiales bacterium]